jgi:Zn-dependent protease with chaperone function
VIVAAYLVALAIAAGCAYLSLASFRMLNLAGIIVGIGAAACAVTILWSIVPRRDRFTPPGPLLDPSSQPRLFQEIAAIAAEFEEPVPEAAYLVLEANAWVAQRGGLLGFGSHRVMALGLPLFSTFTIAEFRAILAHEFAHYYGGDTGFGRFVGNARDSLIRSLRSLSSGSGILGFMSRWAYVAILRLLVVSLFGLYWRLFLWLTLLVSRRWEYRADELACAVAGGTYLVNGLRKLPHVELAWFSFLESEVGPAIQAGVRPPLSDGFVRYAAAPNVSNTVGAKAAKLLAAEKPDALSTHPTFKQRAARALAYGDSSIPADDQPAITLLADAPGLERSALEVALPAVRVGALHPIQWDRLGETVYIPSWYAFAAESRELLSPYQVRDIPELILRLGVFGGKIRDPKGTLLSREQRADRCTTLLWNAFALALLDAGWELRSEPGDFTFVRGEQRLAPRDLVTRLRAAGISPSCFQDLVERAGAAALPLAPAERSFAAPHPTPMEPQGPQHLMIRPRWRVLRWQAVAGCGVFAFLALVLWLTELHTFLVFAVLGIVAACIILKEFAWFHRSAPKAIAATPECLAVTWHDGTQQRVPWPSIVLAEHSSRKPGMQWELTVASQEPVVLCDTGIDSNRWAMLHSVIVHFANLHGAEVREGSENVDASAGASETPE